MKRALAVSALFATLAVLPTAAAQHDRHGQLGTGQFPDVVPVRTCRPSSSAAWRCCIPTGSTTPARRSAASWSRIPAARWRTGALRSICWATRCRRRRRREPRARRGRRSKERASVEVKTERERAWIDAIRTYFRDHDTLPVDTRLLAYNNAMQRAGGALSGRLRGAGVLRADAAGRRRRRAT